METLQTLALALGLSSLAGLRLYLTVFLTSLSLHQGWLHLHPQFESLNILGSDAILIASGVLLVLEFLADKVAGFDSLWDSVHTLIRPIGATVLALQVLGDWPPEAKVIAGLCAGTVALTVHSAKAGTRLLVNTLPEPFSNVAVSAAEDIAVAGLFGLLVTHPLAGGAVVLSGVIVCAWFTPRALRAAKTTAWLFWQRLTRRPSDIARPELPRQLSADHDMLVGDAIGHDATVVWAVETLASRPRRIPGLQNNRFGLLVATHESPGTLVFLAKKLFRATAVPLRLDGCHVTTEPRFLSENLVIYHKRYRRRAVFRFAKAEAPIVYRLAEDIRARIDAPLPTPSWPALSEPEPAPLTAA
jgi:Domain of unknown function (DUF4126)